MARGAPDFGATAPRGLTAPLLDQGELAVRLGSPVSFDRLGFVVHQTLCDEPVTTTNVQLFTSATADLMAGRGLFGGYGLRLRADTAAGSRAIRRAKLPLVALGAVGCEIVWWSDSDCEAAVAYLAAQHAGSRRFTMLRVNYTNGRTEYFTDAGIWSDTPTQPDGLDTDGRWHSLKVVQDATDGTWVRATFDGQELGMNGILGEGTGGTDSRMEVQARSMQITGTTAGRDLWLGALIATVNEPT